MHKRTLCGGCVPLIISESKEWILMKFGIRNLTDVRFKFGMSQSSTTPICNVA